MEFFGFVLIFFAVAIYFLPLIIAALRNHRQAVAISVLNVFLGWTLIGWVVALIWAVMNESGAANRN